MFALRPFCRSAWRHRHSPERMLGRTPSETCEVSWASRRTRNIDARPGGGGFFFGDPGWLRERVEEVGIAPHLVDYAGLTDGTASANPRSALRRSSPTPRFSALGPLTVLFRRISYTTY